MKNSQALVKTVLLASTCLFFLLLQNCQDKKPAAPKHTAFAGTFRAPLERSLLSPASL